MYDQKLIAILVLLVAALTFGLHHYLSQPKNIFDELYLEMKGNYLGENDFYKIKDADIKNYKIIDKDMNETDKFEPTISYPNRLNLANSDKYIEDHSKVKTYLAKYGIMASDLDKYYDEIVNQKVLKDWCSIYDSKFSPKDYGDVTVKTEWENW
ncbi:TipC family immunity protein [Streptococcus sp. SL1232]|uniref:TipC family immunity protein n=1 Tax=Streptococcus vicugnae TaxID=2740579 RepID=UPI0018F712CF|nr:TipC family immunity protein [Streptococcus vicugnae]